MKNARQSTILMLIEQHDIETQEELTAMLQSMGIKATQGTVSRDIKELRLVKSTSTTGKYKYVTTQTVEQSHTERFIHMFVASVLSISYANNIVVIKTLPGSANVAGEAIDNMNLPNILGTMAGDNTVLVIVSSNEDVPNVVQLFYDYLRT